MATKKTPPTPQITEAALKQLIGNRISAEATLIPTADRSFEVLVNYLDRNELLKTYDGGIRTFANPMRAIDWAQRIGLLKLHLTVDLKTWKGTSK